MSGPGWLPYAALTGAVATTLFTLVSGSSLARAVPGDVSVRSLETSPAARRQVAAAAFMRMVPVIKHPRCLNCHSDMSFKEVDPEREDHYNSATGVTTNTLVPGNRATHPGGELSEDAKCVDCHTKASDWQLGPQWPAASLYRLCLKFKDARGSGKLLLEHVETDELIKLAFEGMKGQDLPPEPPPMSHPEFLAATKAWIAAMNAMAKFPKDPEGCPHDVLWVGSIEYEYSEAVLKTTVTASGKVEFDKYGSGGEWNGQAERVEDHNAKDCPSVLTLVATGNGANMPLNVLDMTAGSVMTGVGSPMNPSAFASLTVSPMGYSVRLTLALEGKGAYAGGGPGCPGYVPHRKDYNFIINGAGEGKVDPRNPDEFSGASTVHPSPSITLTTKWKLTRTRE